MSDDVFEHPLAADLIDACRAVVGEELRSITYFSEETVEQVLLRDDLERAADLTEFADRERRGFGSGSTYSNTELGEYGATIRMFEHGYLVRVIREKHGVWVTTDDLSMGRFEDLTDELAAVLDEADVIETGSEDGEKTEVE
ncbi:hypothetical protein ACLI4Z_16990 [Natrialbaceae archaeon A-arb3/5]